MRTFDDFVAALKKFGLMALSQNAINWINLAQLVPEEHWHTDLPTDPWQWRIKIEEEGLAAYGKLFDKKPGFIDIAWYPKSLAARRLGKTFKECYQQGTYSQYAREIYSLFEENDRLALYEIKSLGGFTKDQNYRVEAALTELQMGMFITCSGTKQKRNQQGEPYGWPATAYQTVEAWAGKGLIEEANQIDPQEARKMIIEQVKTILPNSDPKKIKRFLGL